MSNSKPSVLILGAGGALGKVFTKVFNTGEFNLTITKRAAYPEDMGHGYRIYPFDVRNHPPFCANEFDYIINCIGVTEQKIKFGDTASELNALEVNGVFPYKLAKHCKKAKIIHLSDAAVFGYSEGGRTENDWPQPLNIYQKSKFAGEAIAQNVLNLRFAVIGPGTPLFEKFKEDRKTGQVKGYENCVVNPMTSLHLAQIVRGIIRNKNFSWGHHHLIPSGRVTHFELITQLNQYPWGEKDRAAEIIDEKNSFSFDCSLKTVRFTNNMSLWRGAGSLAPLDVKTMIREMAIWVEENKIK